MKCGDFASGENDAEREMRETYKHLLVKLADLESELV